MKLIIAGGRDYEFTQEDYERLDVIHAATPVTMVLSGGAKGADACGERWAYFQRVPKYVFLPDWSAHGRAAGPKRNQTMAEQGDALAAFPGGRGTADMMRRARARGLRIFDFTGGFTDAKKE